MPTSCLLWHLRKTLTFTTVKISYKQENLGLCIPVPSGNYDLFTPTLSIHVSWEKLHTPQIHRNKLALRLPWVSSTSKSI